MSEKSPTDKDMRKVQVLSSAPLNQALANLPATFLLHDSTRFNTGLAGFQQDLIPYLFSPYTVACHQHPLARIYDSPYRSGVYFLLLDDIIFYVGQSKCVYSRLLAHLRDRKPFRAFTCIDVPEELLDPVEAFYIHAFSPPWNSDVPDDEWGVSELVEAAREGRFRLPGMPSTYRLPDPPDYWFTSRTAFQKPWESVVSFRSPAALGWTTWSSEQAERWM